MNLEICSTFKSEKIIFQLINKWIISLTSDISTNKRNYFITYRNELIKIMLETSLYEYNDFEGLVNFLIIF